MNNLHLVDLTDVNDVSGLCRLCLLNEGNMISLYENTKDFNEKTTTIFHELQQFSKIKLSKDPTYPSFICAECVNLLKVTWKIRLQMKLSQKQLVKYFNARANSVEKEPQIEEVTNSLQTAKVAPVEIISSKGRFNLKELIIVEEKREEEVSRRRYEGFLRNLGSVISAKFVDKTNWNKENVLEDPVLHIIPLKGKEIESADLSTPPKNTMTRTSLNTISGRKFSNKTFLCQVCGFVAKNRDQFAYHKSSRHPSQVYKCDICGKSYSLKYRLKQHIATHKDILQKHQDNDSPISLDTESVKHVETNSQFSNHTFLCQICGFIGKKREHLAYHMSSKHSSETYKCDICNKVYTMKHRLKQHKIIHKNERPYLCTVCGDNFNYRSALDYHMRTHTGEKSFKCSYCPKAFGMSWSLKRHLTIHTGARPYECRHCGKGFSSMGDLKCHILLHTGERPHRCQHCKKGFTRNYKLRLHMLSHKGPFKCSFCRRRFLDQSLLKLHYKISHGIRKDDVNNIAVRNEVCYQTDDEDCEEQGMGQEEYPEENQEDSQQEEYQEDYQGIDNEEEIAQEEGEMEEEEYREVEQEEKIEQEEYQEVEIGLQEQIVHQEEEPEL